MLDPALDPFASKFTSAGPSDDAEGEAFYLLARLLYRNGRAERAAELYRKIVSWNPAFRDAAERLVELETDGHPEVSTTPPGGTTVDCEPPWMPSGGTGPWQPSPAVAPTQLARPVTGAGAGVDPATSQNPSTDPTRVFFEGATIAGRYRLGRKLGEAGMAMVFAAEDLELSDTVALKVFSQAVSPAQLPSTLARFRQELKLNRQLAHPNVIRMYDIGVHEGFRYITMELLKGSSLAAFVGRPIETRIVIGWLIQACLGLQAAHEQGIVHRDIKPDNLWVNENGSIKVLDFGIAKAFGETDVNLTQAGVVIGTPLYMSPEQCQGAAVGPAADLYSVGVLAFQLFTGRLPFDSQEPVPLLLAHMNRPPPRPRDLNPALREDLEAIILKLLEKAPEARFGSARELAQALAAVLKTL